MPTDHFQFSNLNIRSVLAHVRRIRVRARM
jgi:hypothetical protein